MSVESDPVGPGFHFIFQYINPDKPRGYEITQNIPQEKGKNNIYFDN